MRFKLLLFDDTGPTATLLAATADEAVVARLRASISSVITTSKGAQFLGGNQIKPGRKGRQVMVIGLDVKESPVLQYGDLFDSANALSQALGFKYNAAGLALARAAGGSAVLKGVEFQYTDKLGHVD